MHAIQFLPCLAALATTSVLIAVIIRQKGSYFNDVKGYLVASILAFAVFILSGLFLRLIPSEATALYMGRVGVSAFLVACVAIGLSALTLEKKLRFGFRKGFRARELLREPLLMIYVGFFFVMLVLTWALIPFQVTALTSFISGEMIYVPIFVSWYVISLFLVFGFLFAYPCYTLLSLSRWSGVNEKAAEALSGHAICWISLGLFTFVFNAFIRPSAGVVELGEVGYLFSTVFLIVLVYLYRETTVLENLPKAYSPIRLREGEVAVMLYTSAVDKMKILSTFIREELASGDMVSYKYPDEESETVRAKLREYGIDVEKYERNGTLRLTSLTEYYMPDGNFDKERAIKKGLDERAEAMRKGCKHYVDLDDVGDCSFLNGQWQKYLEFWDDPRWGALPGVGIVYKPFIIELTVFNVEGMGEGQVADLVKAFCGEERARLIDLIEHADAFSKTLALDHKQLVGRKLLFEFDPVSSYERVVRDFVTEATANVETAVVFTPRGSPIHSALSQDNNLRFFLFTQQVSAPTMGDSETEMLLPASNSSLMLDALEKLLNASAQGRVCLVFDSLSELISSIGLEKTFKFIQYVLEMLYSEGVTALFLLTSSAHDPKAVSMLRGMFEDQLAYGEKGIRVVKLSKA
ncbi:MAG: MEDS domain-containing protein [Candidatus Bathyarchaeota archaeon]|nr:MEDS domain-containing protein [Candidatus Bathyarchaeota archaeon]MDH5532522.1 MEDS domain-containing protein [Candidatus Bathyarchaeota archaeon]MDH5746156.1 MEDS domain-containing protein [Candidatus Bathyarchaeota archaeon]